MVAEESHQRLDWRYISYASASSDDRRGNVEGRYGSDSDRSSQHHEASYEHCGGQPRTESWILLDDTPESCGAHTEEEDD